MFLRHDSVILLDLKQILVQTERVASQGCQGLTHSAVAMWMWNRSSECPWAPSAWEFSQTQREGELGEGVLELHSGQTLYANGVAKSRDTHTQPLSSLMHAPLSHRTSLIKHRFKDKIMGSFKTATSFSRALNPARTFRVHGYMIADPGPTMPVLEEDPLRGREGQKKHEGNSGQRLLRAVSLKCPK